MEEAVKNKRKHRKSRWNFSLSPGSAGMLLALFHCTLEPQSATRYRIFLGFGWNTSLKLMVVKSRGKITGKSFPKPFTGGSKIPDFYLWLSFRGHTGFLHYPWVWYRALEKVPSPWMCLDLISQLKHKSITSKIPNKKEPKLIELMLELVRNFKCTQECLPLNNVFTINAKITTF